MTVVDLCTSSGHALYFYQVLWNYLKRYQSYRADTISILKISKGNNSAKNVGGVTVVDLCKSSGHALYFYQVLWNYLKRYQSYRADTISIWKITKGNNSTKNVGGVRVVDLCKSSGHALYFYQVLWNYLKQYQSYRANTISILKITKGNNSPKNVGGVTVVELCMLSGHALYFYQVLWNNLKRYQSYRADTISIPKISKGNNSAKNVGGVNVVNLCMSSGHAFYLCQVSWNYLEQYQSYRADTISIRKITKGNNSAKNVGGVTVPYLCTLSGHALYFYQVLWNYLNWYQSYRADTISILKITKGNNSAKNVDGVMVVDLCMSSGHALYFYQGLWNYLKQYESYRADTISIRKISKGNNSAKNVGGVTVVDLCKSSGHALYFYQVLWNYLKWYQSYRADTISIRKITKGNNFTKNVGGVRVVDLCKSSGHALYFYQVLWNYLKQYQSYRANTISILKITKGNNSAKNVGGVTVVELCMLSGHALYFYQVLWNNLKRYQSYRADTNVQPLTDGRTDGRTDTQKFGGYNIIPRHFLWRGIISIEVINLPFQELQFSLHIVCSSAQHLSLFSPALVSTVLSF